MSRAIAIIESDTVANVIVADSWPGGIDVTNLTPRPAPGWTYDGQSFTPPTVGPEPEPQPPLTHTRLMTHYAFNERLTLDEDVALEMALPSSPLLRVALRRFQNAQNVDVGLTETQQMVGLLAVTLRAGEPEGGLTIIEPIRMAALLAHKPLTERGAIHPVTQVVTP